MDYEGFKTEILKLADINLSQYKEKQMKRRIDSLIRKNKCESYREYVNALRTCKELYDEFINYLTINVSEFYRNPEQWEILIEHIFPDILKRSSFLKIWSAACSTGDEPYTLVMALNHYAPLKNIKILATDIDNEAINKAKAGIYSEKSIEKLPAQYLKKYFRREDNSYIINDDIKSCVDFKRINLLKDPYPDNCDLVVCRNVLIYFTEEAKAEVFKKLNKALRMGGVLFIGSTEQIIMSGKYSLKPVKTFFYIKEGEIRNEPAREQNNLSC